MNRRYQSITIAVIAMFIVTLSSGSVVGRASEQATIAPQISAPPTTPSTSKPIKPDTGEFTLVNSGLPTGGAVGVWGDYDRDGKLDVLYGTSLYHNNGNGTFTLVNSNLPTPYGGRASWADFNNDNYPDILLSGTTYVHNIPIAIVEVCLNNHNATFTCATLYGPAIGVSNDGYAAAGDYDNDGHIDVLYVGAPDSQHSSHLYHNTGGQFTEVPIALPSIGSPNVSWADYDKDGYLDLAISGYFYADNAYETHIYHNNQGMGFTDINANLPGVGSSGFGFGSMVWGDYDNNGYPDCLLSGTGPNGAVTYLFRNLGSGSFTVVPTGLPGGHSAAWGDYDNDGRPDILLNTDYSNQVFRNLGNGTFSDINAGLAATSSAGAWGDYNNDRRLDILLTGVGLYRSNVAALNDAPSTPFGLTATTLTDGSVRLSWLPASDNQTPSAGLSYNVRVGSTPGGTDILSPLANAPGFPYVPQPGSNGERTFTVVKGLQPSHTYYWSVQAIDSTLAGGPFAPEQNFIVTVPSTPFTDIGSSLGGYLAGFAGAWGDYDGDGRLDLITSGVTSHTAGETHLIHNDGGDSFTGIPFSLPVLATSISWHDYNKDGWLDFFISGYIFGQNGGIASIYHNNMDSSFTDIGANLTGVSDSSAAWADYDKDGNTDLIITGLVGGCCNQYPITKLYHNDAGGNFTDSGVNFPAVHAGNVSWADYNNDGYPDLSLTGVMSDGTKIARIYRNNGDGTFTDINAGLPGLQYGGVAWGDYDNDGKLDFILTGVSDSGPITRIYHNNGNESFTAINAALPGLQGEVAWGDYNNDGYSDFILTGQTSSGYFTDVYRNNHNGTFTAINAGLPQDMIPAAWGDYNNDGKLDLFLMGNTVTRTLNKVYRNDSGTNNSPPTAPTSLVVSNLTDNSAILSWQPASDDHTPASGLSYNLRVGTYPGGADVVGPTANTSVITIPNGYRVVPQLGNAYESTSFPLKGLRAGSAYYWSVQAIDTAFAGGPFAQEGSFTTTGNTPTPIPTATPTVTPTPQPTVCPNPFVDINTNIFFHAINSLYCQGVINGTDATHYTPGGTATRGQFAKLVTLAFGLPLLTPQGGQSFTDVPPSYFAYIYIESGYAAHILSGFDAAGCAAHNALYPCYLPNVAITRAQLTKLVVNAGGYALLTPASGPTFSDVPPSNVFYAFIETAAANHIISGYPDGTFRPNNNIRRDEMAQIVYAGQQNQPASPTPSKTDTPSQTSTPFVTNTPGGPTSTSTPTPIPSATITPTALR